MRERMVRFENLEGSAEGSVDSGIPGYERKIFNVMGFEAPETEESGEKIVASPVGQVNARYSAIPHPAGFSLAYVECEPGNGVIYHTHDTNETFIPVTGRWRVYWGEDESVDLEPRDVISFPGPVPRRFLNIGEESALMLAIVAGDSPRIFVDPEALERARQTGPGGPIGSATATSTT
jgi:quercetin dioxygenase-like cupin family protein